MFCAWSVSPAADSATERGRRDQQRHGVLIVLGDGEVLVADVVQHIGPRSGQEARVPVAPFGQRSHRLERPVGTAVHVLRQILGE